MTLQLHYIYAAMYRISLPWQVPLRWSVNPIEAVLLKVDAMHPLQHGVVYKHQTHIFIFRHICRALRRSGWEVRVKVTRSRAAWPPASTAIPAMRRCGWYPRPRASATSAAAVACTLCQTGAPLRLTCAVLLQPGSLVAMLTGLVLCVRLGFCKALHAAHAMLACSVQIEHSTKARIAHCMRPCTFPA